MIDNAFAIVLRKLRVEQGFSQESFAHAVGIHRTYVSQLERGLKSPSLNTVQKVTAVLNISIATFMRLVEAEMRGENALKSFAWDESERLLNGIRAAYAIPMIDDISSFIWEAIFSYAKQIPIVDPLHNTRKKLLYDIVDSERQIGWSAKALQVALNAPFEFELVIQRADIFKKADSLGFPPLSVDSPTQLLGQALLKHWQDKIVNDGIQQNIRQKRIAVLLKSRDRRSYILYEDELAIYDVNEIVWSWTDASKTGLQGKRTADNFTVYRWYPNQKQLFERFKIDENRPTFNLEPERVPLDEVVSLLVHRLTH